MVRPQLHPPASLSPRAEAWALRAVCIALGLLVVAGALPASAGSDGSYGYPVEDGLLATVVGTARADAAPTPTDVPVEFRRFVRFPDRAIPRAFWHRDGLPWALSAQKGPAPLVFVIAGTGASHVAAKVQSLRKELWGAGFHVVALGSPTHPDFILNAAEMPAPGNLPEDSRDLYAVMRGIRDELADEIEVRGFRLTGYSLGGTQAAFLGWIDARERAFGFERIVLLNPSVSLYTSTRILDRFVVEGLGENGEGFEDLMTRLLTRVTREVHAEGRGALDSELLYRIAQQETAAGRPPSRRDLLGLIGTVFRISSAQMLFSSDVMLGGGRVVEPGAWPGIGRSLTIYLRRAVRWSFERYIDDLLVPAWRARRPGLDRDRMIEDADLRSIGDWLASAVQVSVMTNADDFILSPEDLAFLRETFGPRLVLYPRGGHCGNLDYRENVATMLRLLEAPGSEGPP